MEESRLNNFYKRLMNEAILAVGANDLLTRLDVQFNWNTHKYTAYVWTARDEKYKITETDDGEFISELVLK